MQSHRCRLGRVVSNTQAASDVASINNQSIQHPPMSYRHHASSRRVANNSSHRCDLPINLGCVLALCIGVLHGGQLEHAHAKAARSKQSRDDDTGSLVKVSGKPPPCVNCTYLYTSTFSLYFSSYSSGAMNSGVPASRPSV